MYLLPLPIDDLIHARAIESVRREFKESWNDRTRDAVIKTVCAFANDLQNLNGGYLILGVGEENGLPKLPATGLQPAEVDQVQREIRGWCNRIAPDYQPVLAPVEHQGRQLLVVWAPPGDVRPYEAPEHGGKGAARKYWVRMGSETVEARGELRTQLLEQANRVPFDDRRRSEAPLSAVSAELVRAHLTDVRSGLLAAAPPLGLAELLRAMRLTAPLNGGEAPKNAALLLFAEDPEQYFPGARVEVAQFGDDAGGDLIEEKVFRGPLPRQIRDTLAYLDRLSADLVRKTPGQAEVRRHVAFPYEALEEALANAVLHRGYDAPPEPIKVYLFPDRLEITSYPGPMPGLKRSDLEPGARPPSAPLRNRRIGDFLKELRLAEMRGTGIPTIRRKMQENGSPPPAFEFDDERTYFRVTLPAHPEYVALHSLREAAQLWATGSRPRAIDRLASARKAAPDSGALAAQLIEYCAAAGDFARAQAVFAEAAANPLLANASLPLLALARAHLDRGQSPEAASLLAKLSDLTDAQDALEVAILHKRAGKLEHAHDVFRQAYPRLQNDPKAVHEFAQTKLLLAGKQAGRGPAGRAARARLNREARELLHRAIQLADSPVRKAWAWYDLGRTLAWLRAPETEILEACQNAIQLLPDEPRFQDWLARRQRSRPGD